MGQSLPSRPYGQNPPIQSTYVEVGGAGIAYSLNYDAIFDSGWGFRIGGGYIPEEVIHSKYSDSKYLGTDLLVVLLMGEYTLGRERNRLETSFGVLFGESNLTDEYIPAPDLPGLPFSVGYRWLPRESGKLTLKVAFTPIISLGDGKLFPTVGVSVGVVLDSGKEGEVQ